MAETIIVAGFPAIIGRLISFSFQYLQFKHEIAAINAEQKTDFMAESTVIHFLSHKSFTDRSFETLKIHLGGIEDDELRKILVRAGDIRVFRDTDVTDEWWRLLSRNEEYILKKR